MAPHSRYNSRFLRVLSRQAHALRDQSQAVSRWVKMMGTWSAQLLIYPFYRLFGGLASINQSFGTSIHQAFGRLNAGNERIESSPPPSSYSSDSSIHRVLAAIKVTYSSESEQKGQIESGLLSSSHLAIGPLITTVAGHSVKPGWRSRAISLVKAGISIFRRPFSKSSLLQSSSLNSFRPSTSAVQWVVGSGVPTIQGFATVLTTRKIVLVTPNQELLDVFSAEQQTQLYSRMIWEVANFYYRRKQQQKRSRALRPFKTVLSWMPASSAFLNSGQQQLSLPSEKAVPTSLQAILRRVSISAQDLFAGTKDRFKTRPFSPLALTPKSTSSQGMIPKKALPQALKAWLQSSPCLFRQNNKPPILNSQCQTLGNIIKLPNRVVHTFRAVIPSNLRAWLVRSVVGAIALLPMVVIPAIAVESTSSSGPIPLKVIETEAQWVDPNQIGSKKLSLATLQELVAQKIQGKRWLSTQLQSSKHDHRSSFDDLSLSPSHDPLRSSFSESPHRSFIDVRAEVLGYEPHLLEILLDWIDALLVYVEAGLALSWKLVGILTLLLWSIVQKIRQFITP